MWYPPCHLPYITVRTDVQQREQR
uniref:Uncharacterized protein n=1 Tax=Anguilla anguilla TaxID=7936 RepID=A0A0E9UUM5_ANGAN